MTKRTTKEINSSVWSAAETWFAPKKHVLFEKGCQYRMIMRSSQHLPPENSIFKTPNFGWSGVLTLWSSRTLNGSERSEPSQLGINWNPPPNLSDMPGRLKNKPKSMPAQVSPLFDWIWSKSRAWFQKDKEERGLEHRYHDHDVLWGRVGRRTLASVRYYSDPYRTSKSNPFQPQSYQRILTCAEEKVLRDSCSFFHSLEPEKTRKLIEIYTTCKKSFKWFGQRSSEYSQGVPTSYRT